MHLKVPSIFIVQVEIKYKPKTGLTLRANSKKQHPGERIEKFEKLRPTNKILSTLKICLLRVKIKSKYPQSFYHQNMQRKKFASTLKSSNVFFVFIAYVFKYCKDEYYIKG